MREVRYLVVKLVTRPAANYVFQTGLLHMVGFMSLGVKMQVSVRK